MEYKYLKIQIKLQINGINPSVSVESAILAVDRGHFLRNNP